MYFKMKSKVEQINFPTLHGYIWDKEKKEFNKGNLDFVNDYSLFFFYEQDNMLVLLPVTNRKITQSINITYMGIQKDIKSILDDSINKEVIEIKDANFLEFSAQIHDKLSSYIIRTIDMIRWRLALRGVHDYLKPEDYQFSVDGKVWFKMPFKKDITIRAYGDSSIHYTTINQALNLTQIYDCEPLEHEIYREAYNNLNNNPRSSLLMAVASAEIGFKRLATELHPQNEWLLKEIQSPSLFKMLREYLPLLPAKLDINGSVFVPKRIKTTINKSTKKRNDLVHNGSFEIDEEELLEILDAIKDLLYLFDYYRGLKWALGNISLKTQKDLGII